MEDYILMKDEGLNAYKGLRLKDKGCRMKNVG